MKAKAGTSFDVTSPWKVDQRILEKLKGSFFYSIANMIPYKQCHIFQAFIKDCYDKNTKTFTFGPNRDIHLYFGLEDIYALPGIPVDGKPLICDDIPADVLCMNMLGSYKLCGNKKMQVSKAWLRQSFEVVPADLTEVELIYHVRAYLLYLIGTRILPNSDNSRYFPAYWLQFLKDVNACGLNGVAWGAAAHCLLTSTITSNTSDGFLGPTWLYEMFFLERIPKIMDCFLRVELSNESEKDIPLHEYYCPRMIAPGKRTNNKPNLKKDMENIRHNMTNQDIVLTPYCDYPSYCAQRIFFSRSVLINFNKLQYHEPEKAPQQLSITNLEEVSEQEALKTRMSRGTTQRNYCKRYEKYIKMWKQERHQENICIKDTSPSFTLPLCPDQGSFEDEIDEKDETDATHETTHDEEGDTSFNDEDDTAASFNENFFTSPSTGEKDHDQLKELVDEEPLIAFVHQVKKRKIRRDLVYQLGKG